MAVYQTDNYGNGSAVSARSGVYPQIALFTTATSPGTPFQTSTVLGTSDLINLFWIPTPGRVHRYAIDIGDLDGAAGLVMVLEDGQGNVYQSGITTGQASGRLTDATARIAQVGQILYTSQASAYLRLRPTTATASGITTSAQITGDALFKHE